MKKYIWVGVLLCVSAYASNNPFELQENFGQLEHEQEGLFTDLKKISDTGDSLNEETTTKEKEVPSLDKVSVEKNVADERLNEMRQKALEASKKEAEKKQQVVVPEVVKKEETAGGVSKDLVAQEVATYEKKREIKLDEAAALEKLAKEQKEAKEKKLAEEKQKEEAQKLMKEQKEAKARRLAAEQKVKQETMAKEAAKKKVQKVKMTNSLPKATKTKASQGVKISDIDIEKEKREAKEAADRAYEEAVKEMSEED